MRGRQLAPPQFPKPPEQYNAENEAQFRRAVERSLADTMPNLREVTKTLVIPAAACIPESDAFTWDFGAGGADPWINPDAVGQLIVRGAVLIPTGVEVREIRVQLYRAAVGDTASYGFSRVNNDRTTTALVSGSHSTTGWETLTGTLTDEIARSTAGYVLRVQLQSTVASTDARFLLAEIDYTAPDYSKTY